MKNLVGLPILAAAAFSGGFSGAWLLSSGGGFSTLSARLAESTPAGNALN
jgi:hypothetical protein